MPKKYYRNYRRRRTQKSLLQDFFDTFADFSWQIISLPFKILDRKIMRRIWHFVLPSVGTTSRTILQEKVKSKAEKRIADYLTASRIKYIYEKPLYVWFFTKKIRPDFYLPEYDTYIEYFGLLQHPRLGARYRHEVKFKMRHYKRKKIKFIVLDHRHYANLEDHLQKKLRELVGWFSG